MPPDKGSPSTDAQAALGWALRERLLSLGYHAFLHCMADLLTALGYEDVQLSGRTNWKGRNAHGGYDLMALLPSPPGRRRVIAQVKQYPPERLLFQRSIDELRGACLRTGASEAMLITTSGFSPTLRPPLLASTPLAPVRLIDGEGLIGLLIRHGIGVKEAPHPCLDTAYFERLQSHFPGSGRPLYDTCSFLVTLSLPRPAANTKAAGAKDIPKPPRW